MGKLKFTQNNAEINDCTKKQQIVKKQSATQKTGNKQILAKICLLPVLIIGNDVVLPFSIG